MRLDTVRTPRWTRRRFLGGLVSAAGVLAVAPARAFTPRVGTADIAPRRVAQLVVPRRTRVGEVFDIRRTLPGPGVEQVDPFLMLDHFDFPIAKGQLGGLAPHPHRGFETVTVLLDGAIEHGDSLGNRGLLEPGGVQWMTAGAGIVHEENPADVLRERGGRVRGVQLWVNLPARAKMTPPAYQDTPFARVPTYSEAGVTARVFAGAAHDVTAVIGTHTPMALIDYGLAPGAELVLDWPPAWSAFVHVVDGLVDVGGARVAEAHLAVLTGGSGLYVQNPGPRPARLLVGGGEPIAEPVARYGPFTMNTQAELQVAVDDYRSGRMGRVANPTYERIRLR
ncbi:MAG: pirin family protein [Deltaproteobacteria bacterium]|nr:pirin family protein [Deltaproteobacteria bacterium]